MMKDQIRKIKENWLIMVLLVVLLLAASFLNVFSGSFTGAGVLTGEIPYDESYGYGAPDGGFFSEKEDGMIARSGSLKMEVPAGKFRESESKLKDTIKSGNSTILEENVMDYGRGGRTYKSGRYEIKIKSSEYDSVLNRLKKIGEITLLGDRSKDETGNYYDAATELKNEKERLARYLKIYDETTEVKDKIAVEDRIFDQQRKIDYLERRIGDIDERVEYTTLSVSITEKPSEYADAALAGFGSLVTGLTKSINLLLHVAFVLLPWVAAILLVAMIRRKTRASKQKTIA